MFLVLGHFQGQPENGLGPLENGEGCYEGSCQDMSTAWIQNHLPVRPCATSVLGLEKSHGCGLLSYFFPWIDVTDERRYQVFASKIPDDMLRKS